MPDEEVLKVLGKSAIMIFIGTVVGSGLNYLVRILVARFFDPSGYGLISLGLAVFNASITISVLGLRSGVTRWISKNLDSKGKVKGIIYSALQFSIPISILMMFILFLFSEDISLLIGDPKLVEILRILSFGIPFGVLTQIYTGGIRGLQNTLYKIYSYDVTWPLLKVIFTGIVILLGYSLKEVVLSHVAAIMITSIVSFYLLRKLLPFDKVKTVKFSKRKLLSFSWPLMISSILFLLISWMDTFMIGIFKTSYEVGIYNAALPTASVLLFISFSFKYLFLPKSTEFLANGQIEELKKSYHSIIRWILLISLPMFLIMIIFPNKILGFLFGSEFSIGGSTLSLLALGYFYASIVGPTGDILISSGKTKSFMLISIITTVTNFAINYFLIPIFSYYGAAIALTGSFIVGWTLSVILVYREFGMSPFKKQLLKPLFLGLFLSLPIYILHKYIGMNISQIILASLIFLGSYILLLFKLEIVEEREKKLIRSAINKVLG